MDNETGPSLHGKPYHCIACILNLRELEFQLLCDIKYQPAVTSDGSNQVETEKFNCGRSFYKENDMSYSDIRTLLFGAHDFDHS